MIKLVDQSTLVKDPMPLVLGETLMSLDIDKTDPTSILSGIKSGASSSKSWNSTSNLILNLHS